MIGTRPEWMIELAALADQAAVECEWEHQFVKAIVGEHADDLTRQQLADAFRFHARDSDADEERFGPMVTFDNGASIPSPLRDVSPETCAVWAAVVEHSRNSRVRARLHDLLFECRRGDIGLHGASAVDAYLEDAGLADPPSLRTLDGLKRAYQLARLLVAATFSMQLPKIC